MVGMVVHVDHRESRHVVGDIEDLRARLGGVRESIGQTLLQIESVGNDDRRVVHCLDVLGRWLEVVRVEPIGDERHDVGMSLDQFFDDCSKDGVRHHHIRKIDPRRSRRGDRVRHGVRIGAYRRVLRRTGEPEDR